MYEELMNEEEMRRTIELECYFVVLPAFKSVYEKIEYVYPGTIQEGIEKPYNSSTQPIMSRNELREYLVTHNLLLEG